MKRVVWAFVLGYVILGLITRAMEASGAYTCACDPDCWCKRPGLSLFRWVFPRFHRIREQEVWKRQQSDA